MAASAESIRKRLEEKKREIEAKLAAAASSSSSITTVGLHPPATGPRVSLSSSFGIKDVSTQSLLGKRSSSASNQPESPLIKDEMDVLISDLARTVSSRGSDALQMYINSGDPRYEFLDDPSCPHYHLYRRRLQELQSNGSSSSTQPNRVDGADAVSAETPSKKQRASRWGPPPAVSVPVGAAVSGMDMKPFAVVSAINEEQLHALQLMQLRTQLAAKDMALKAKAGVVEADCAGPSLEHRQRAAEMAKTQEEAARLTQPLGEGKHHIQDFLPKEALAKFEENLRKQRVSPGGTVSMLAQYEENKLDESNVGFKMLKKFGWTEGKGLGASGAGIAAPISSVAPMERAGLGTKRPDEPADDDDEFSLYRKRMMLAYKYRPNPLNNPRRPYY